MEERRNGGSFGSLMKICEKQKRSTRCDNRNGRNQTAANLKSKLISIIIFSSPLDTIVRGTEERLRFRRFRRIEENSRKIETIDAMTETGAVELTRIEA